MSRFIIYIAFIVFLSACGGAPDYNPLDLKWAKYIAANPGGEGADKQRVAEAKFTAEALEKTGHNLYRAKKDRLAILEYEKALKLHASGRLYLRYADSLSNIPRLEDSVKAYGIALALGYTNSGLTAYNAACAYSRMGNADQALAMLRRAAADGYKAIGHLSVDKDLAAVRKDPRWQSLLDELQEGPRAEFRLAYGNRKLGNDRINALFIFKVDADFDRTGKGTFTLEPVDEDRKRKEEEGRYFMPDQGEFLLKGDRIELLIPNSYMSFARQLTVRAAGAGRLLINGQPYTVR
jgi:tetratricopeptide (TPR) repeat protein